MKKIAAVLTVYGLLFGACARPCRNYTAEEREVDRQVSYIWARCEANGIPDWDSNGEVNCCDKAVSFIREWRKVYGREARLCQQTTLKLNHMYVQLRMDWGWWSIDPAWDVYGSHDMQRVWGKRYQDNADNINAYWVRFSTVAVGE